MGNKKVEATLLEAKRFSFEWAKFCSIGTIENVIWSYHVTWSVDKNIDEVKTMIVLIISFQLLDSSLNKA